MMSIHLKVGGSERDRVSLINVGVAAGKWATTKLLDCSFVVRLIGYGLTRKDSRI